jgi:DNA ligase D-like protein (predicted 3'-phosphoesterase)
MIPGSTGTKNKKRLLVVKMYGMGTHIYNKKRDFNKTPEPKGRIIRKKSGDPVFVIQKHDATNLHYDLRLEIAGTLKSWSVPKGPSTDTRIKRMAIPTEDHPMEYAQFEGTIPKGQYGGGTVMVWDKGTFTNLKMDGDNNPISLEESYAMGTLEVFLRGKKLSGGYALIKMKKGGMKGNWLLIKMDDKHADARRNPTTTQNNSELTGRTLKQIEKGES